MDAKNIVNKDMKNKAGFVDVNVIIFPDGSTHFFSVFPEFVKVPSKNIKYSEKAIGMWTEKNLEKYMEIDKSRLLMAMARIRMVMSDFIEVVKNNDFEVVLD